MNLKKFWNKYTRGGLIIVVGLGFALIAALINQNMLNSQIQTESIIVVKEDIAPYKAITKEQLMHQEVALSAVPLDAISNADELDFSNLYAGEYGFSKGSALRKDYLTTSEDSKLGTALGLPEGMVEVGIQTTLAQSAGDGAKPGVYVDAVAITSNTTGQSQKITKQQNPNLANLLVVKRLNAEGMEPDPESGNSQIPAVVVVQVTEAQAADLAMYQEQGKLYLTPAGVKQEEAKAEEETPAPKTQEEQTAAPQG